MEIQQLKAKNHGLNTQLDSLAAEHQGLADLLSAAKKVIHRNLFVYVWVGLGGKVFSGGNGRCGRGTSLSPRRRWRGEVRRSLNRVASSFRNFAESYSDVKT